MAVTQYRGTGRRKTSVARVILTPGAGKIEINGRTAEDYFPVEIIRQNAFSPISLARLDGKLDIQINVHGGGYNGQAGAVRHGVARALLLFDSGLRPELKRAGYLTRDAREVERKKYGLRKARRATQFSKR